MEEKYEEERIERFLEEDEDYPVKKKPECNHMWINVGFNTIRMVCAKCDIDKPTRSEQRS